MLPNSCRLSLHQLIVSKIQVDEHYGDHESEYHTRQQHYRDEQLLLDGPRLLDLEATYPPWLFTDQSCRAPQGHLLRISPILEGHLLKLSTLTHKFTLNNQEISNHLTIPSTALNCPAPSSRYPYSLKIMQFPQLLCSSPIAIPSNTFPLRFTNYQYSPRPP